MVFYLTLFERSAAPICLILFQAHVLFDSHSTSATLLSDGSGRWDISAYMLLTFVYVC